MASLTISAFFKEIPLNQQKCSQDIIKTAQKMKLGRSVQVSYLAGANPRTRLDIKTSFIISGSITRYISTCMQFLGGIGHLGNFAKKSKTISLFFDKDWMIKPLIEGIRAFCETASPKDQIYLTPIEGGYAVCKIKQVLNYFHQLTGTHYTTLLTCFEKNDDITLMPINQQCLELLRLIAPSRDIDKDTMFMWQVAPISGVLDSSGDDEKDKTELVRIRDSLMEREWIFKSEGNYDVTDLFKEINVYSISYDL